MRIYPRRINRAREIYLPTLKAGIISKWLVEICASGYARQVMLAVETATDYIVAGSSGRESNRA